MNRRAIALLLCALPAAGAAPAAEWLDVESRIQYAYFTEDARALHSLVASLAGAPDADGDALRAYYLGLAQYRLTLLSIGQDKDAAKVAAEACVDHLADANEARKDFAEALALQAGCMGLLSGLKPWKAPLLGPRSSAQLERARELDARNPRVLLLDALGDYESPAFAGGDKERAFGKLQTAVAAFETERQGVTPVPGWGVAEAYTWLARSNLDRGDAIAARSALERALLLAPDFALAKRLMTKITTG